MYNENNLNSIQNSQTTHSAKRSTWDVFHLAEDRKENEKKKDDERE